MAAVFQVRASRDRGKGETKGNDTDAKGETSPSKPRSDKPCAAKSLMKGKDYLCGVYFKRVRAKRWPLKRAGLVSAKGHDPDSAPVMS